MESAVEYLWYKNRFLGYLLFPLACLFSLIVFFRRQYLTRQSAKLPLKTPIIVIGNITVGGTGKTPVVIALVNELKAKGYKPGVVSRGYGGEANYPYLLNDNTTAAESGDEPLLIYKRCACPVVVSPLRNEAIAYLQKHSDIDVIVSDDGLQHYAMPRTIEIAVIDAQRGLGNGLCLPAGPLREPSSRLKTVDIVLVNGSTKKVFHLKQCYMQLVGELLVPLPPTENHRGLPICSKVNGVAAIGNPQRFYSALKAQGYAVVPQPFVDHHLYQESELEFANGLPVIMTEKDAVKCMHFTALDQHWYLPINAHIDPCFFDVILAKLSDIRDTK